MKATVNCVQMYIDRGVDEIEMKILEQRYMTSNEIVDSVGCDANRAVHIHNETLDEFMSSNSMKSLRKEGNTLFLFSDFGENFYEEVAAFRVRERGYNRLIVKNRKGDGILVRNIEKEKHNIINIIDINSDIVKNDVNDFMDNGFKQLERNQDLIISMKHRNEIHVMLGRSVAEIVVDDQKEAA